MCKRCVQMNRIQTIFFRPHLPHSYRNARIWVHLVFLAAYGIGNLFYGSFIVPIFLQAMSDMEEVGPAAFFEGAPWMLMVAITPIGLLHYCSAIFCVAGSLASLDALKERLLNTRPRQANGEKQSGDNMLDRS